MQEQLDEKSREAVSWKDFSERVSGDREAQKRAKEENQEKIDALENQLDILEENIAKVTEDNEQLQKTIKNVKNDNSMKENVIASSARAISRLQEQIKEEKKKNRDGQALFGANAAAAPAAAPMADVEKENFTKRIEQLEAEKRRLRELADQHGQEIQRLRAQLGETKAPPKIYVTKAGSCYHEANCNHLLHGREPRPKVEYRRCEDCMGG